MARQLLMIVIFVFLLLCWPQVLALGDQEIKFSFNDIKDEKEVHPPPQSSQSHATLRPQSDQRAGQSNKDKDHVHNGPHKEDRKAQQATEIALDQTFSVQQIETPQFIDKCQLDIISKLKRSHMSNKFRTKDF